MDKDTRNAIERATQRARKLLEEDFAAQLEGVFDVHKDGEVAARAGKHLSARQAFSRERIIAAIEHKRAAGMSPADAARDYLRDAAFTTLNRFGALKMLEGRELVQECITKGEQSAGYREFCGMAPGLPLLPDSAGYRLYVESLFDELSTEVKVLFDRRDPSSVLWPKRETFEQLLVILNATELAGVWSEDETIGWVYQFFNGQDERRKMREESHAPRDSRELAVRNQFFTPRYVVQFLTDNTLGRMWYEMRGTKTVLAEMCEYLVRKPGEEFALRAKKDPRDLRVLDPACGSGHFLLYAFDLLLAIYEEALEDPESPRSEATGKTLAEDYPSVDALRKAVPGLILAHNLHGVDIDPRCAQIAQLALWMRAQKAFRDFGIERRERPQIRRSNIVVAEPLVAEGEMGQEFVARLGDPELERVFKHLAEALSLAGELGLLLQVEALVAPSAGRGSADLFAPSEERLRSVIARFATEGVADTSTRRRLFVDDALHGLGVLSLARKKFDVALMNPPFGDATRRATSYLDREYPQSRGNILAQFIERVEQLLAPGARMGAIVSRTCFYLPTFSDFRRSVLGGRLSLECFADLGVGVLDAMVETAACTWKASTPAKESTAVFFRQLSAPDKAAPLLTSVRRIARGDHDRDCFEVNPSQFDVLSDRPYVYWLKADILEKLASHPPLDPTVCSIRVGLQTGDDFRFLRAWWEVDGEHVIVPLHPDRLDEVREECIRSSYGKGRWGWYSKTEAALPVLSSIHLVVNWKSNGREIKAFHVANGHSASKYVMSEQQYFRPGLSYMLRSSRLVPYLVPAGSLPTAGRSQVYPADGQELWLAALLSSNLATAVARFRGEKFWWPKFQNSMVSAVPYVAPQRESDREEASARIASIRHQMAETFKADETEILFVSPASKYVEPEWSRSSILGEALDRRLAEVYGLTLEEFAAVERDHSEASATRSAVGDVDGSVDSILAPEQSDRERGADIKSEVSWCVGTAFGRFDPRLATGERTLPLDPKPFDALPSRSPGMYPEGEKPAIAPHILVDDEGNADDLAARALAVAETVKVDVPENLRGWLAREFFQLHIKMYSKSRRKAPIYWQLATPSASYSVWLYIHAFSKDTLFRVQNDYVTSKLAHEERRLDSLRADLRVGATADQRRTLAAQEGFVEELRVFLEEVKRVAPVWNPNLDDGVIVNFAPLWRLVPHHKPWQKELKATWDALCDGEYDWAHLAMHLWPERVVPKCAKDRSLAIAHGLDDVFWVEGAGGKWTARKAPTRSADDLVRERTSPAVKSALKSLLEAPVAIGNSRGRKSGGRRKAAAIVEGGDA